MGIKEIWIPEALAVIFLASPAVGRLFERSRKFQPNRLAVGFGWLRFIALCIALAIFPAYGFRPECLAVLAFALATNAANLFFWLSDLASWERGVYARFRRKPGPVSAVFALIFLALAAIPMFVFSPEFTEAENAPVTIAGINNTRFSGGAEGREYILRVYGDLGEGRPVIFIVPPEVGSAVSVGIVCHALQKKGFTVVTYFCDLIDTPLIDKNGRKRPASIAKLFSYLRMSKRAGEFAAVNERGKALEAERRADIQYLLPDVLTRFFEDNDLPPVLFVGYGAGGSALAYLSGIGGLESFYGNALGAVSIEGRLWSSYQAQPRPVTGELAEAPAEKNFFLRQWAALKNYAARNEIINPQKAERSGPLPDSNIPVLYLVSGRALENGKGQKKYRAVFDAMRFSEGPAALAVIESAGPLDYQDFPLTYPIFSFLLPGKKGAKKSKNPVFETADIIGNYASFLLEKARREAPFLETEPADKEDAFDDEYPVSKPETAIPPRNAVNSSFYFESKGLKGFRP